MQACKREVRYVANYTYDHIGQAVQDADPPVWVDVVPLRLSKTQPHQKQADTVEVKRSVVMPEKVATSDKVSLEVKKDCLLARSESPSALDQTATVEISSGHHLPTQDSASVYGQPHSSQGNPVDTNIDQEGNTEAVLDERIDAQDEEIQEQTAVPEQTQLSPKASSVHSSSSSDMFVDAGEDVPRSAAALCSKGLLNVYHPEMRLSHEADERSVRRTLLADSTPPVVRRPGKQVGKVAPELLFFGNDEEEDNDEDEVLAAVQAGPSRLPYSAPTKENKAQADSVDMDSTMVEVAMSASPPRDEPEAVTKSSSISMNERGQTTSKATHATKAPKSEKGKGKMTVKAEGKKKAKDVGEERRKARKPIRRRLDEHGESQSDDDLTQSLNVDNFVKSTSTKEKELKRRRNLLRLQQRQARALKRRQGIDLPSSESSVSDLGSTSSSSSSDDDDVDSFVVSDTETQQKDSKRKSQADSSSRSSAVKQRRLPSPPVLSESRLLAYVQSLDSRMRFREYVRWLVLYALDIETDEQDLKRLGAVRAKLRDDFTMLYRSLTTMSNRRQFTWYLTHFPQFERRLMSAEEKKNHVGCHACHRKSQRCEYAFTCWGALYHLSTLTKLSKSEHTSSAMSDDSEDHKLVSKNEKKEKVFTFFLGESCAIKSSVKHKLYHWERRALSDVTKLPAFKELRGKESEDVSTGEVEDIVNSYYMKLSRRFQVLKNHTGQLAMDNFSSYTKIRDRWDED